MNYDAVANMEEIARTVLKMYSEEQTKLWEELKNKLSVTEVEILQKCVALYDIFTNEQKYKIIRNAICKQLVKECEKV